MQRIADSVTLAQERLRPAEVGVATTRVTGESFNRRWLMKDGSIVPGRVEMFAYLDMEHLPDAPLRDKAVPPNLGILSASLASSDLDADCARLCELGAEPVARARVSLPGFGPCEVATLFGPDGELLELFNRAGTGS